MAIIPALLVSSIIIFFTINAVPGRASSAALGYNPTPEAVAAFDKRYGLDKPLYIQYTSWLFGAIRGDFGHSLQTNIDISSEIARRLPVTLELTFLSFMVVMIISFPLGIIAAERRGKAVDVLSSVTTLIGLSIPSFVTATALVLIISIELGWLLSGGYVPFLEDPIQNLKLMALPSISLGSVSAALLMRILRTSLIDVLNKDYIRTARARGATRWRVLRVHAVRNAAIPFITVGAMELGVIFGGSVIIEKIFQLPGIGSYVLLGIETRDFRVLQAGVLVITAFVLFANLFVDLIAAWLDPRIREKRIIGK
jgi:peptide/nickel transport system permease protein